jgi:hypothetical protein
MREGDPEAWQLVILRCFYRICIDEAQPTASSAVNQQGQSIQMQGVVHRTIGWRASKIVLKMRHARVALLKLPEIEMHCTTRLPGRVRI